MKKQANAFGMRGAAGLAALGLLAACVTSLQPLDPEVQAACIGEAGITGSYSVTSTLLGDRMTYVVGPGPGVTQAQTDLANACIARSIGSGSMAAPVAGPFSSRPASGVGTQCKKGAGALQGGAGYC
jgi:hypothetical protein